jgi:hypothetical protein
MTIDVSLHQKKIWEVLMKIEQVMAFHKMKNHEIKNNKQKKLRVQHL